MQEMKFTDEDLKRLKEYSLKLEALPVHSSATIDHHKLKALLARLEAAERVLNTSWADNMEEYLKATKDWRKAAGK